MRAHLAEGAAQHPLDHAQVVAEARPEETALVVRAEPVDVGDDRRVCDELFHVQPVLPVVAHVIAAEGEHRHRVAAGLADLALGRGGLFGSHDAADKYAVGPVPALVNERRGLGTAAAEHDRGDGNALRVFKLARNARAVDRRRGEAGVRMRAGHAGGGIPRLALPVERVCRRVLIEPFPPDGAVRLENDVREDGIPARRGEGVGVRFLARAGSDAEKAVFGVDGPEPAVRAGAQPGDIVADAPALPALLAPRRRRNEHREVGLAAGGRERAADIPDFALGVLHAENEHVLGKPPLFAAQRGGNAQREAFLAEQRVAAVAGVDGHDKVFLREVRNITLVGVELGLGVETLYEVRRIAERFIDLRADARHDRHAADNVDRVGDLHAVLGKRRADRTHRVGDNVHRPAAHAPGVDIAQLCLHLVRRHPVVRGAGVLFLSAADERAALDAGDVVERAAVVYTARQLFLVELDELAGNVGLAAQLLELRLRTVDPKNLVRLHQRAALFDPVGDIMVGRICHFRSLLSFYIILFIIDGKVPFDNGICRKKWEILQFSFVELA